MQLVQPRLVVAIGATAARGVFRRRLTISKARGSARPLDDACGRVTMHPSHRLRLDDAAIKRRAWNAFLDDLAVARDWLAAGEADR